MLGGKESKITVWQRFLEPPTAQNPVEKNVNIPGSKYFSHHRVTDVFPEKTGIIT